MSSTITSTSFVPYQPSPLNAKSSPFKDVRTASPSTPRTTAKLWDEYERRAIENAKRRETTCGSNSPQTPQSQRFSSGTVLDIIKSYGPSASTTASPQIGFGFLAPGHPESFPCSPSTTVAICKSCKQGINSASGVCELCMKTIVLPPRSGESTPLLSPSCRNFASTDLPKLQQESASGSTTPTSSSPKRRSQRKPSAQLVNPPIRLSSLQRPPGHDTNSPLSGSPRCRKASLTDPNEPFLRLQISRKPVHRTAPPSPTTPTSASRTSSSNNRTRPSSLAPITTPPQYANYSRHASATPSELSTLYPYISNSTTTPPSVSRASYSLQNTTSAWDDWDSDEEDKAGLVGYWRGKKWRGSRGSLAGSSGRRDSAVKDDSGKEESKRKGRRFVRVISCGCGEKE